MKRSRLNLKLNCLVNFRSNEDIYKQFNQKCKQIGQFTQDRINSLIMTDLGIPVIFTSHQPDIQTTLHAASDE